MALLRKTDPELFELLSTTPGSQEDEDMLKMFTGAGGGGEDDIGDAELAEMMKVRGGAGGGRAIGEWEELHHAAVLRL